MKTDLNLNYLVMDLDESEMASVAGGVNATFLNRWAGKINAGTLNMKTIYQRLVNDSNKNILFSSDVTNWKASATASQIAAWKSVVPALQNYIQQAAFPVGGTISSVSASYNYLSNF